MSFSVLVASKSEQKIAPVKEAFEKHFSWFLINVLWTLAPSWINEQPVGHQETRQWALNRLAHAKSTWKHDYYVSIENGLLSLWDRWYDFGHVIIENQDGHLQEVITQTVQFPTDAVEEAKRRWFKDITVWKILQEMYPKLDHADPHYSLTHWIYTRKQLLYNALIWLLWELWDR
jgi:non-canonical (house-cleaning) NTP pyrophosphatase